MTVSQLIDSLGKLLERAPEYATARIEVLGVQDDTSRACGGWVGAVMDDDSLAVIISAEEDC